MDKEPYDSRVAPENDDRDLLIKAQNGDKQAFGKIVNRYKHRAFTTALGLTGSSEAALDLSQEAFVRAYRAIKRFDPDRPFFTWYYRILRNLCLNYLRNHARQARPFSEIGETFINQIPDQGEDAEAHLEKQELAELVWRAINQLTALEREVIILREFQNLSYREIAEILQISQGTVMSRLYNARRALKTRIMGEINE